MGLSRSRSITLLVSLATLTSNTLSSLLFAQLPDDPFHLANNFGWYLHFANILSVFGFIGALRQHPLSIAIFANYLLLDTILCSIPRFLLLGLLNSFSNTICSFPSSSFSYSYSTPSFSQQSSPSNFKQQQQQQNELGVVDGQSCTSIIGLAQIALVVGVLSATVLQFVGALAVREYAKGLWVREGLVEGIGYGTGIGTGLVDVGDVDVDVDVEVAAGGSYDAGGILERGLRNEERRKTEMVEEWGFKGLGVIREDEGEGEK